MTPMLRTSFGLQRFAAMTNSSNVGNSGAREASGLIEAALSVANPRGCSTKSSVQSGPVEDDVRVYPSFVGTRHLSWRPRIALENPTFGGSFVTVDRLSFVDLSSIRDVNGLQQAREEIRSDFSKIRRFPLRVFG